MNAVPSPELENLIGEAVRGFVQTHRRPPTTTQAVWLPLTVRGDTDLAELVRWFKLLCASEALRERFLSGAIALDLKLAPAPAAVSGAPAQPPAGTPCSNPPLALDESVVTEVVLRQHRAAGQVVILKPRAVITPAARDYARTVGIRMERSST